MKIFIMSLMIIPGRRSNIISKRRKTCSSSTLYKQQPSLNAEVFPQIASKFRPIFQHSSSSPEFPPIQLQLDHEMFIPSSLPSLSGKIFIVTGGNTGIGYATCLNLVAKDARVYMGARSSSKADAAIAKIKETHPDADLHILIMDNTSLNTVVKAAKNFISRESHLHGLILNAGIMAVP